MTRKEEEPGSALSDYEAAVAAFIRNNGVTRCPTACATPTQASVPAADRAALRRYQAAREQRREQRMAGRPLVFGAPSRR